MSELSVWMDAAAVIVALKELESRAEGAMEYAPKKGAEAAYNSARRTDLFQDQTGKLRGRLRISGEGRKWVVSDPVPYASYVNDGTRPHVIKAKGKPLTFQVNGHWVSTWKDVNHPGTKARPYMDRAAVEGAFVMSDTLEKKLEQAISRFNV